MISSLTRVDVHYSSLTLQKAQFPQLHFSAFLFIHHQKNFTERKSHSDGKITHRKIRNIKKSMSYPQICDQLLTLHLSPPWDGHVLGVTRGPVMEKECSSNCSFLLEFIQKKLHLEVYTNQRTYNQHNLYGHLPVLNISSFHVKRDTQTFLKK